MDFSVKIIGVLHHGHQYKCKHKQEEQQQRCVSWIWLSELVSGSLRRDKRVYNGADQLSMDLHHQSPPWADPGVLLSLPGPARCDGTHPGGRRCSELRGQEWVQPRAERAV